MSLRRIGTAWAGAARGCVGAALFSCAIGASAGAQSATATAFAYQYADVSSMFSAFSPPGCVEGSGSGTSAVAASTSCNVPPVVPGGTGTLTAQASSSFDALQGAFHSSASIVANDYTLTQFIPEYASNQRTYPGTLRPDAVGVTTTVGLSDSFSLNAQPGVTPATVSFFFNVDGMLRADPSLDGGHQVASSLVNICAVDCSGLTPNAFVGIAGFNLLDTPGQVFQETSSAPAGATAPTVTFVGSDSPSAVNGTLTFGGIPVSDGTSPYDFAFLLGTQAAIYHSTDTFGHLAIGCDPNAGECDEDPVTFNGETEADFGNTITLTGYKIFDANGNDITNSVKLTFASGLTPAVVGTPEPGSLVLLATGLAGFGAFVRRRRKSDTDTN